MSLFAFPRINFWGTQIANPGTGNNDSASPGEELTVVSDTEQVAAMTDGMSDEEFRTWMMQLDPNGPGLLRAQWNYFGDMSIRFVDVRVNSVMLDYGKLVTSNQDDSLVGSPVSLNSALMCDANPEGFNSTQIFSESLEIGPSAAFGGKGMFLSRKPSRACTRWLNWYRNMSYHGRFGLPPTGVNGELSSGGAGGASASFQCAIHVNKEDLDSIPGASSKDEDVILHRLLAGSSPAVQALVAELKKPETAGLILRYNLYSCYPNYSDTELAKLFAQGHYLANPSYGLVLGTISPWYTGESESITMGRFLKPCTSFPNPYRTNKDYYLSPCIAAVNAEAQQISIDTINCLPEDGPEVEKYNLGEVSIGIRKATAPGTDPAKNKAKVTTIGTLDNTRIAFTEQGGIYDICYSDLGSEQKQWIENNDYELVLQTSLHGVLLYEPEYMLAADSECNYLNELPPGRHWSDPGVRKEQDDKPFPALQNRVPLYLRQRGKLPAAKTSVKVEQWKFTPTGFFGSGEYRYPILLDSTRVDIEGGEKCFRMEPMDGSGVRFFRFVPEGNWPQNMSPEHFANMVFQEYYAVLRVLPYKDYSHISDEDLTFELIYREIFRYYHLILPAMSQRLDMSDPSIWKTPTAAMYILRMADERIWNSCDYMPRTRDLSQCRQQLLHRFCKKVLREHGQQGRIDASVENASAKGA